MGFDTVRDQYRRAGPRWRNLGNPSENIRVAFSIDDAWPRTYEDVDIFWQSDAPAKLFTVSSNQQTERMRAQQTVFTISPQIHARHDPLLEGAPAIVRPQPASLR